LGNGKKKKEKEKGIGKRNNSTYSVQISGG
jgi:hypothetical protein